MYNLDLSFNDILEDIFSENLDLNETKVKSFCDDILKLENIDIN
jgi:hypothetical protein